MNPLVDAMTFSKTGLTRWIPGLKAALELGRTAFAALKPAGKNPRRIDIAAPINGIVKPLEARLGRNIGAGQVLVSMILANPPSPSAFMSGPSSRAARSTASPPATMHAPAFRPTAPR